MAKKISKNVPISHSLAKVLGFLLWLSGIIVVLVVSFAMIEGTISVRWIPQEFYYFVGVVIVILTLLGVLMEIIKQF